MLGNDKIVLKSYKGLNYFQFKDLLDFGVNHAYTLKSDGFDFSFNVEEEKKSYEILAEALNIDSNIIVKPVQTHTKKVLCIDKFRDDLKDVDGLITNKENIALTSKNADCILFLFYEPEKRVIANVHSGWKGTFQKIAEITAEKMISFYGCNPENIRVYINPSIRGCHFEVDEDVKDLCLDIFGFTNRTDEFIKTGRKIDGVQKYNIDTVLINKILLTELGIKEENIIDCGICSYCDREYVHSARAEGKNFKRGTAIIVL